MTNGGYNNYPLFVEVERISLATFNFKRAMSFLWRLIEKVIIWCCGRQGLHSQHQFIQLVCMKKAQCLF